jgi:diguanylate cyclase (GGDEF)-like protein
LSDRLRRLVEKSLLTVENGETIGVTVSIGATIAGMGDTTETLIERADKLMFESKRRGRNLVSLELQEG